MAVMGPRSAPDTVVGRGTESDTGQVAAVTDPRQPDR